MHSVSHSAARPDGRESRHHETVQRIVVAARALAVEHGVDGFTMDDLASATGVSRRTLFNHVPGKDDAVLGPLPEIPEDAVATFVAGGPHQSLVDDLVELVVRLLRERPETPQEVALARRALLANARLMQLAVQRMEDYVESSIGLVEQREGAAFDRPRFDVAVALVVACLHEAMDRYLTGEHGDDLVPVLHSTIATARELLG